MAAPRERFEWSEKDTIGLITARSSLNLLFTRKKGMAAHGWEMVAATVLCGATPYQCRKKFENLQAKYKEIISPPTGEGLEEATHPAHDWPFYDAMHAFMSGRHTISPLLLIQSATSSSTSTPKSNALNSGDSTSGAFASGASTSSASASGASSSRDSSSHSLTNTSSSEISISDNEELLQPPRKRRRVPAARPKNDIPELVALYREDITVQATDRKTAREVEQDFLKVIKEFLLNKDSTPKK